MKQFYCLCFILFVIGKSSAQFQNNIKYDEVYSPCGFAGCYANYYVGRIGDKINGKYCLLDSNKIELTKCVYDAFDFCSDYCGVWFVNGYLKAKRNNKWGFVNEKGLEVIDCVFDSTGYFYMGLALACKNGKWGVINDKGELIIENKYDFANGPFENVYIVGRGNSKKRKKGLIDFLGTEVSPIVYDDFIIKKTTNQLFNDDVAMVRHENKYGWINKKGEKIIPCKYEDALFFYAGIAGVKENGKWGFINRKGEYIIKNKIDSIIQLNDTINRNSNWFAIVIKDGQSIFIDNEGRKIKDCPFSRVEGFSSGMAAVLDSSNHWGFMDTTFSLKIPCRYSYIPEYCIMTWRYPPKFSGSNCLVSITDVSYGTSGTFGIINTKGAEIIPRSDCFFELPPGENYFAVICSQNGKLGLIDHNLNLVVQCIYDEFYQLWHYQPFELYSECSSAHYYIKEGELIPAKLKNQYGYIDRNGVVKIPFIYELASHFENGKAKVTLNGVEITIDKNGNKIK